MRGKKVYVGMSGGVDSSVSAALLKERGFDVTGVFIKVWQPEWLESTGGCTWREDRLDAMRVCIELDISFKTLDLEKEYKREVVDYMIGEYESGRTPNPDVMCNRHVKFGGFFDWAMEQGVDYVATGHYARIKEETRDGQKNFKLVAGLDQGKDQSYFLWTLTQKELSRTIFPVGDMEKEKTRELARKFKLSVAEKKDSQGLCFMGKVDIKEFLSHYIEPERGEVLNASGEVVGWHDGAIFLTLGERCSFKSIKKSPEERPFYVIGRDVKKNTVTVSLRSQTGTLPAEKKEYELASTNWTPDEPISGKIYTARVRHLGEFYSCMIKKETISFKKPVIIASGQVVVLYDGEECLGGGIVI